MIRSLIWKEWHEQRWKLGFGSIILMSFAAIGLRARLISDEQVIFSVIGVAGLMLPVLVSMGLVAPERADGSVNSLRALPISARLIMGIKTLVGLVVCAGPLIAAAVVSCLIAGGREMTTGQMLDMYARGMGVVLSLMLWMLAASISLPTEARAGMVGMGILIIWLLGTMGLAYFANRGQIDLWSAGLSGPTNARWLLTICPLGFLQIFGPAMPSPLATLAVQTLIGLGLFAWAAHRLGQKTRRDA